MNARMLRRTRARDMVAPMQSGPECTLRPAFLNFPQGYSIPSSGSAYGRIRRNVRNGLAVVTVKRDACGGCFNRIPPQRQVEIRQGKKLIVCEYCGRILVADPEEGME